MTPEKIDQDDAKALKDALAFGVWHFEEAVMFHCTTAHQKGYDAAVADVVAWLRNCLSATWPPRSRHEIADAIECGEHLKAKD